MKDLDQFEIMQKIADSALSTIEAGWSELIVNYFVEDSRSGFVNSYLIKENGALVEKSLPVADDLDSWLRKLQTHLAQNQRPLFTRCKLHIGANGKFDASYGYEKVDWDALLAPEWNFLPES
ncbi:hypothetical protein ACEN9J_11320 [Variovorax sp. Varisp41]|uniref:hypothetical protein n=1 Tax=unclassified Variovorax TaxID=663243 RepID=UPI0039B3F1BC